MKSVLIVGGGISGLATAYYLSRRRPGAHITLLERSDEWGGTIRTLRRDGFVLEGGPDSFLTAKPWAVELCRELGLEGSLVPMHPRHRKSYVFRRGEFHPLPDGLALGIPTRILPMLLSRVLSWRGKLRMGLDLLLPRGEDQEDESLGSFMRRRFGHEAVDRLAEPLLGGIFHAPLDELSLRSTLPRFQEMERNHRSLIRAMRRAPSGPPDASPLFTLREGMSQLVESLRRALPRADFRTGVHVTRVDPRGRVETDRGVETAEAVVLALPAHQAAALLPESEKSESIPCASAATVSLGYRSPPVSIEKDGSGFVLDRSGDRRIRACTWSSQKFEGRAPRDHMLVRCYLEAGHLSPSDMIRTAREELRDTMGLEGEPVVAAAFPWPHRLPVMKVGHERRIQSLLASARGIFLCGAGIDGSGIPDCIRQGKLTAESIASRMV